ncbi:MAG: enoyl-CoA hydratase/isomerase family protein [Deltaproteobacteria bacterium]|nr:enoyl-CoA hydratase/isomerase family protein [Deltaproteobacteria bacterium]
MGEVVVTERRGSVAAIRMNRPERLNAYNEEMGAALLSSVSAAAADPEVRCLVLSGTGKAFSAGGDVESFAAFQDEGPGRFMGLAIGLHALIATIRRAPKPVVAAVNGVAAGAGFSLALACDVAVAAASARFTLGYQNIGLSPDGGMTFFLARAVGAQRAMEMTLFSRILPAARAAEWGLVQEVLPDGDFSAGIDALADRLASGPTLAYARAKELYNRALAQPLESQLEEERQQISRCAGSRDFREGIRAFLEKRPARFEGR